MIKRIQYLHNESVKWANFHKRAERNLVEIFIVDQQARIWEHFDKRNMYEYSIEILGLSEPVTQTLIHLANKAKQVPEFRKAIAQDKISVSKAARIAAHVEGNKSLIEFAATHSKREIEIKVAKLNPEGEPVNKAKMIGGDKVQLTVTISREAFEAIERTQSLLAQKNLPATLSDAVEANAYQYIDRKDPVKIAERNQEKSCPGKIFGPLTAAQKHAVYLRDQGRCTDTDHEGKRCNSDRWTQTHHIIPRECGGTNDLENLTTLCGFHHRLLHKTAALDQHAHKH